MIHINRCNKFKSVILLPVLLVFIVCGAWIYRQWPESPVNEIKAAGNAIISARDAEANKYAPRLYQKTLLLYDSAMFCWKMENQRFILKRDYGKTIGYARQAALMGNEAGEKAVEKAQSVHHTTALTVEELEKTIAYYKKVYSPLPLQKSLRKTFNQASMIISEAKLAREKSDFHIAETKLAKAEELLISADRKARTMLENYFESYPRWTALVRDALKESARRNTTVVIVDKMAHECRVYHDGKLTSVFDAEFGPNWIGHKMYKGDQATPEGKYHVVQKKERRKTIYHKALLLNYPNENDKTMYKANIAARKISPKNEIGSLIEIHGHGGQGFDWTNGCISLADKDMDVVYSMVKEKTVVVIVGSLDPLEKITENAGKK